MSLIEEDVLEMSESERRAYVVKQFNVPLSFSDIDFEKDFGKEKKDLWEGLIVEALGPNKGVLNVMFEGYGQWDKTRFCIGLMLLCIKKGYLKHGIDIAHHMTIWDLYQSFLEKDCHGQKRDGLYIKSWNQLKDVKFLFITNLGAENVGLKQKEFESSLIELVISRRYLGQHTFFSSFCEKETLYDRYSPVFVDFLKNLVWQKVGSN